MIDEISALDDEIGTLRPRAAVERYLARLGRRAGRFAGAAMALSDAERRRADVERENAERREATAFASDLAELIDALEQKASADRRLELLRGERSELGVTPDLERRYNVLVGAHPLSAVDSVAIELDVAERGRSAIIGPREALVLKQWRALNVDLTAAGVAFESAGSRINAILERYPALRGIPADELRGMLA